MLITLFMMTMLTQKCCSLTRKVHSTVQSTKALPSCLSKNSPAVIKTFSQNFVTATCRCPTNYRCFLQRNTSSIYRHSRIRTLFEGLPKKKFKFREFSTKSDLPIIYLFTKDGCSLCDVAKEALKPHMHRFILEEVDITLPENERWYEMYKYEIPVFHIYEEFLFKHRVDFDALERGLEKYKHGFKTSK